MNTRGRQDIKHTTGRFISQDPIKADGANWYNYCMGDCPPQKLHPREK